LGVSNWRGAPETTAQGNGVNETVNSIRRLETTVVFGLILAFVINSRLFIYTFRHIPLTDQGGGQEPIYALVGGAALAFSAPAVPLLVAYLAVLFTARKAAAKSERELLPAGLFLLAFVIAFVITISGKPSLVANSLYGGRWIIDLFGGLFVVFYGLKAFAESGLVKSLPLARVLKGRGDGLLLGPSVLGLVTGLLVFHHLDPFYDSVFFLSGRAGALSHHPLSVSSFGLGLSAVYLLMAHGFDLGVFPKWVSKGTPWAKGMVGLLNIVFGLSFATGTFSSLAAVITQGQQGRNALISRS